MRNVELQLKIRENWEVVEIDRGTSFSLNYTQSTLTNPTVTTVPYSVQISLPKTKINNQVFACIGIRSTSVIVDPLEKIRFRLYVNGSIFQTGYIKIEDVDIMDNGAYKIRLFGELGGYFGELDDIPLNSLPLDCTHEINHTNVTSLMLNNNGVYGYALTYQGDYDNFDSNLTDNSSSENANLIEESTWSGLIKYATTELNEHKRSEQDYSGEYRSYYQKPTIKFSALFEAIKTKSQSLGYEIEEDPDFFNEDNPYYSKLWLLNNNYSIGDINGSYGFRQEFGDTTQSLSSDNIHITNNEAKEISGGILREIPKSRFKSTSASSQINAPVVVSDYIPVKQGASISAKFNVHPIATSYETANYTHYLFKNTALNTVLRIVDAAGNVLAGGSSYGSATPKTPVSARRFTDLRRNSGNLEIKRPSDKGDGFGKGKNFGYDYSASGSYNNGGNQDNATVWEYEVTLDSVPSGVNGVYIEFFVSGNTWWRTNSNNVDRQYGVAFKVMPGSVISVNNPDEDDESSAIDNSKRSGSQAVFSDMIGSENSCLDLLLSYCKLFGLILNIDNTTNKIWIGLRENYYSDDEGNYTLLDWTNKVDRSREFKIEPLAFNFRRGIFKYNELGTKYEELYKSKNSNKILPDYGSFVVDNGYKLSNSEYNYLDGTIFDNCIIATDYSSYYAGRGNGYADNKELPFLQDNSGSATDINGFIPLFRDDLNQSLNKPIRITDDTDVMQNNGVICWNNNSDVDYYSEISEIPRYLRTIEYKGEVYSLNFSTPNTTYAASENLQNTSSGLYQKFWRSYLNDRMDSNCKILVCYVFLTPTDIQGNILSKFIYLDNEIWVIDEVSNFSAVSNNPTKVRLIKVKDIKNYLDRSNISDSFTIYNGSDLVFDNKTGFIAEPVVINGTDTTVTLTINSSISWRATSGVNISPSSGEADKTVNMTVSIPVTTETASVTFTYGNNTVTVQIIRQTLVTVSASATNGGIVTINGNTSPQQIAVGRNATFNATGTNQFLYWEINGTRYPSSSVTIRVTGPTTGTAYFLAANQVRLYCDDPYTTITGQTKTDNYWILSTGTSYTFNNSQADFSGFLFSSETTFRGTGSKTITANDTYLSVYYNQVLLNLTIVNNSPTYQFTGDGIYLDESTFDFQVEPGATIQETMNGGPGNITFDKLPYHYPTFSQTSFPNPGVYNMTITGNRIGWDGDREEEVSAGRQEITRTCYSPIAFTLTSNVAINPTSGNGETDVNITLLGRGGEVVQNVGDFQYTLKLNQEVTELNLGWTSEYLPILQVNVPYSTTDYSETFYYDGLDYTLSEGLTASNDNGTSFLATATFGENETASPRTLTFYVTVNGMAYQLIITQSGNPDKTEFGSGMIVMWYGTVANIPQGWVLCDGNNNTPNLINRYPRGHSGTGVPGSTGGSDTVNIAVSNLPTTQFSTNTTGAHTHSYEQYQTGNLDLNRFTNQENTDGLSTNPNTSSAGNHSHTFQLNSGSQSALTIVPSYATIHFIMKL